MKITRRKHPDHPVDSCKRLSVNRMAAGSRPPRSSIDYSMDLATLEIMCSSKKSICGSLCIGALQIIGDSKGGC